ncbi:MAG: hypothetical protein WC799_19830 [Desulfobacteraceae bacterium]|jgi:hypothetical protein
MMMTFILILMSLCVTGVLFYTASSEWNSHFFMPHRRGQWSWDVQHDEKLIIPDSRFFYLNYEGHFDIRDFMPYPVSATFGIGAPLLSAWGFYLLGLNNKGLRLFYILIAGMMNCLFVLCLTTLFPGYAGFLFCLIWIMNRNNIMLFRHAVVEMILTFSLVSLLTFYVIQPQFFFSYLHIVCFLSGVLIIFKPNFPFIISTFLLTIAGVEHRSFHELIRLMIYSAGGAVFFELLHAIVLAKIGVLRFRYLNFYTALKSHSGTQAMNTVNYEPGGARVFYESLGMFIEWLGIPVTIRLRNVPAAMKYSVSVLIIVAIVFLLASAPRAIVSLCVFCGVYLSVTAFFFFYIKRIISLFPLFFMMGAYAIYTISGSVLDSALTCVFLSALWIIWQIRLFMRSGHVSSSVIQTNSQTLQSLLPSGATVYAHCFAYRFFWQAGSVRFISGDDQYVKNDDVLEKARSADGDYVLLAGNGGMVDVMAGHPFRYMAHFQTSHIESGIPEIYVLLRKTTVDQTMEINNGDDLESGEAIVGQSILTLLETLKNDQRYRNLAVLTKSLIHGLNYVAHLKHAGETGKTFVCSWNETTRVGIQSLSVVRLCHQTESALMFTIDQAAWEKLMSTGSYFDNHVKPVLLKLYQHGSLLKKTGMDELAEHVFKLLATYDFYSEGVAFHLGEIMVKQKKMKDAVSFFETCIAGNPHHKRAANYLHQLSAES